MLLKTIATGSGGNCHALIADTGEILLLDLGENEKKIKKGIGWKISDVVGAIVTHKHADHSKSVKDFERMGIPVFKPYENTETFVKKYSGFKIQAFDLTTIDGKWTHTDADGTDCPIYGFMIVHKEMGRMLYITDCKVIKWKFKSINHITTSFIPYSNYLLFVSCVSSYNSSSTSQYLQSFATFPVSPLPLHY